MTRFLFPTNIDYMFIPLLKHGYLQKMGASVRYQVGYRDGTIETFLMSTFIRKEMSLYDFLSQGRNLAAIKN